ncbi:PRC-barrel domain-containing protein [Methanoculleus horonobensis]|jgi:sporulation protein YlmC with PRC-barrel domain|uniref:PRC-barrel domain-containing protein n=1 Tax=Methanoculleus horonobensis TaxID=528314 RepID=UPI000A5E6B77|nr:PRC-barrel domain-containing protein [Methanoculleus horonobensis]MDD3071568.1 PRC-barrel domain-containing protein [Methanoculleus horonobensis]MDD4252730.1 PRC-barrel domain-containing protein [Methanoculleus horonobensis]
MFPLDMGAMELKKMQERSEVILERRTRTAGEEWFMSADDILDKNVINQEGDDLGEISDMRIGFPEGKVDYLVLRYGGVLGMAAKRFAVPPEAVIYRPGDDNFVVNIDKQRLDDLPGFDEDHWPREADYSLIQSAGSITPPTREEAEAMKRTETPPPDVVTTERVETRPRRR